MMDIKKIESRRTKILQSEEWENFKDLIDDTREFFAPSAATLQTQVTKGTKIGKRRVNDIGISMRNDYASGVLSETITSGERWFEYHDKEEKSEDVEMFDEMTKLSYDAVNASNFSSEMYRDQNGACVDGTACMYLERIKGRLNFYYAPFGNFAFVQDYRGRPDIVWVEKTTTVGALVGEFGAEKVSKRCKSDFDKDPDKEIKIIYYCAPRMKRDSKKKDVKNKLYELITYEKDSQHLLEEGGTDLQKFVVYRVKRVNNESLGRGPCIDTVCTMASVERCAQDLQRGLRLSVVPVYGVAASMGQNGFRMIHQEDASVMVYNDTGIASPPQVMNPPVNVKFGQVYMEWMIGQMRQLFFLDYFNPLEGRRNMTLGEAKERVSKSQQMVDQIVGPLKEERMNPLLQWVLILLGESGAFSKWGSWEEIQKKMQGRVNIRYTSRLANVQKKIRLMSIAEYSELMMVIAQGIADPVMQYEFLARTDFSKLPNEIREGTNAPLIIMRNEDEAKGMAKEFAEGLARQQELENTVKTADAASKGGTAPESGSLTEMVLGGA